jgi:hypothetical protein
MIRTYFRTFFSVTLSAVKGLGFKMTRFFALLRMTFIIHSRF